jgi:hypothetical protein
METVYVVIRRLSNGCDENHGIYSTEELANEFADEMKENYEEEILVVEVELDTETIF